jgi:hypothetical protein
MVDALIMVTEVAMVLKKSTMENGKTNICWQVLPIHHLLPGHPHGPRPALILAHGRILPPLNSKVGVIMTKAIQMVFGPCLKMFGVVQDQAQAQVQDLTVEEVDIMVDTFVEITDMETTIAVTAAVAKAMEVNNIPKARVFSSLLKMLQLHFLDNLTKLTYKNLIDLSTRLKELKVV